jgi:hypothetical protein
MVYPWNLIRSRDLSATGYGRGYNEISRLETIRDLHKKKCPIVIALSEAMPEGLYVAKRNEAIARSWDCFATLRFARNDSFGINHPLEFS